MGRKDDLEQEILDSYRIVRENNRKIFLAEPKDKARLRQENEENWNYIKDTLAEYTSLCEVRRLTALEDIIDIAATRFSELAARLETTLKSKTVSSPASLPTSIFSSKESPS